MKYQENQASVEFYWFFTKKEKVYKILKLEILENLGIFQELSEAQIRSVLALKNIDDRVHFRANPRIEAKGCECE